MTSAYTVRVRGRVQGVFYRASSADAARRFGVVGWVRNVDDGSVAMHIQGPSAAVDSMLAWTRQGPPGARVDGVEVAPAEVTSGIEGFEIRR